MQVIEMILDESDTAENGVYAISIVTEPAIESNFIHLSKQVHFKTIDNDKRLIIGLALVPNKPILRKDKDNQDFYIYFKEGTIRKTAELFLKRANQNNTTLEHATPADKCTVIESWMVEDTKMDKTAFYGIEAPIGSWAVAMKIDSDSIWNEFIKTGVLKGFSIEGMFSDGDSIEAHKPKELMSAKVMEFKNCNTIKK